MKKVIAYLITIYMLWASEILCQSVIITGRVTAGEEAVKYAVVTFIDESDTTRQYSTVTDTSGNYKVEIIITGIKGENNVHPVKYELGQNYPNPFTGETTIPYSLTEPENTDIRIYDILGQEVRRLESGEQLPGKYEIKWDGRNNAGISVTPGVYFYRLNKEIKKMMYGVGNREIFLNGVPATNPLKRVSKKELQETYIARIENGDSTFPLINKTEIQVQITGKDTTIDFQAEAVEQWHLLGLENEIVSAIAINPEDPAIIYAGSSFNSGPGKMFRSTDSGKTWDTLLVGGNYNKIIIDPENHNRIYASPGIIKSEDGGMTWQTIMEGIELNIDTGIWSFDVNMKNPRVMYAGTGGFSGGAMYRSDDGGLHWSRIPGDSLNNGVSIIVIDQADTSIVYAGTAFSGTLWKSTDSGETWYKTGLGDTGLRISDIFINPQDPEEVYVGLSKRGLMKSVDGGATWDSFNNRLPENFSILKIRTVEIGKMYILGASLEYSGVFEYSSSAKEWMLYKTEDKTIYEDSDFIIDEVQSRIYLGSMGIYYSDININ